MYRRSKFLEVLIEIRQAMARNADFDTDLFVERVRSGPVLDEPGNYTIVESSEPVSGKQKRSSNRSAK